MLDQIVQSQITTIVGASVMSLMGIYLAYRSGNVVKRDYEHITATVLCLFGSIFAIGCSAVLFVAVGGGF